MLLHLVLSLHGMCEDPSEAAAGPGAAVRWLGCCSAGTRCAEAQLQLWRRLLAAAAGWRARVLAPGVHWALCLAASCLQVADWLQLRPGMQAGCCLLRADVGALCERCADAWARCLLVAGWRVAWL